MSLLTALGLLCACAAPALEPSSAPPAKGQNAPALAPAPEFTPATGIESALANARSAIGWNRVVEHPGDVRVTGGAVLMGTESNQVELFNGRNQWFQEFDGPLATRGGFDGTTVWNIGWNGTPRILELGDRITTQVGSAFLSGRWVAEDSELEFTSFERAGEAIALDFVHPEGHLEGQLTLEGDSYLPVQVAWGEGTNRQVWTYDGFRDHQGFRYAESITIQQAGETQSFALRSIEFLDPGATAERFAPDFDRDQPSDTRFAADIPPQIEVKQVPSGHLLVHPLIDGKDLGWFIFDTGAGINCISSSVAGELSDGFGAIVAQGIGGAVNTQFRRAGAIQLGPVTIDGPIFMELDLDFLTAPFGVEVGGIIGYELIARCAVEFDLGNAAIALHDPATYELAAHGKWEAAILYARHPNVRADFEGHEGVFKIDTGAAGDTLALHYQAVVDLGLLDGRKTRLASAGGVGGQVGTRAGKASSFTLGGREFRDLTVGFTTEDKGAFSDDYVWGNIGGQLLEPFVVVFDYTHRRIGFVPKD